MTDNCDQIECWNGETGRRWAARQRDLDAVFAPLTEALFEAADLRPGAHVLDIGCGAGETALIAARRAGREGRVVAADISAPLLAVARERGAAERGDGAAVAWIEADAESHDFGEARFDHALSRFGVMFFADSGRAFANLRRALAPGGRLTFLCWRAIEENPWVTVPFQTMRPLLPDFEPSPPGAPGPFRFADGAALERILAQAGFAQVAVAPIVRTLPLGDSVEAAARFATEMGPVSRMLRECDESLRQRAFAAVVERFAGLARNGAVALDAACWQVTATSLPTTN